MIILSFFSHLISAREEMLDFRHNMSNFSDDTKLCHRADYILELKEDINKLVEWANKWQKNFNVYKCSVTHIGRNNMQSNYNMPYAINSCRQ